MRGHVVGRRTRAWILKGAGVGGHGSEEAISDLRRNGPVAGLEKAIDEFTGGRLLVGDPIEVPVARVAGVMVDIDEDLPVLDALPGLAEPLEAGAIRGNHAVECATWLRGVEEAVRVEEGQLAGHRILVPNGDGLAGVLEGEGQAELGTDAIPIGPDVADDADGVAVANRLHDSLDDALHSGSEVFSSSSMILRTRLPRATDSSTTKRSCGVYFRTTALATRPWMRVRFRWSSSKPVFCCSWPPRMLMKTTADLRSPPTSTSLTVTRPAWSTGISRRMASPISRFRSSRTRSRRWEGMAGSGQGEGRMGCRGIV